VDSLGKPYALVASQKLTQLPYSQTIDEDKEVRASRNQLIKDQMKSIHSVKSTLFHSGVPTLGHKKKSLNYVDSLMKVANVYTKGA